MTQEKVYNGVPLYKMTRMEVIGVLLDVECQRDDLMDLIRARVDMMKPREDCQCLDCATLRQALKVIK